MRQTSARAAGLAAVLLAALLGAASFAAENGGAAPSGASRGPFEERNQFLFNLLFLAFPARSGDLLLPGEQEVQVSEVYANTFVGSNILFSDFPGLPARRRLTSDLLSQAEAAKPGRSLFFVDTEQARTEIRWRTGISPRFEAGLEVPFLSYRGGAFDNLIEGYHRKFGFPSAGRDLYVQNASEIALTLGSHTYFTGRSPDLYQIGDISLFGRLRALHSRSQDIAVSVGAKIPTGDPETLGGSGSGDFGLQAEGTFRWRRQRLHYGGSWVKTGRWALFPGFRPSDTGGLFVGYEFVRSRRISWIAQIQSQTSVFRGAPGADPDLLPPSTEFVGGVKGAAGEKGWSYEAAFVENLFYQNNGVDIGLRAGISFRFASR